MIKIKPKISYSLCLGRGFAFGVVFVMLLCGFGGLSNVKGDPTDDSETPNSVSPPQYCALGNVKTYFLNPPYIVPNSGNGDIVTVFWQIFKSYCTLAIILTDSNSVQKGSTFQHTGIGHGMYNYTLQTTDPTGSWSIDYAITPCLDNCEGWDSARVLKWTQKASSDFYAWDRASTFFNGELYTYGGCYGDGTQATDNMMKYNYATNQWASLNSQPNPGKRYGARMTVIQASPTSYGLALFGGVKGNSGAECVAPYTYYNDTWIWSNGVWTQWTPSGPPVGRYDHVMEYSSSESVVVMYAGNLGSSEPNGTWTLRYSTTLSTWHYIWDFWAPPNPSTYYYPDYGQTGTQRTNGANTAYDAYLGKVAIFGGQGGSGLYDDIWTFSFASRQWSWLSKEYNNSSGPPCGIQTDVVGVSYSPDDGSYMCGGGMAIISRHGTTISYNSGDWRTSIPTYKYSRFAVHIYDTTNHVFILTFSDAYPLQTWALAT